MIETRKLLEKELKRCIAYRDEYDPVIEHIRKQLVAGEEEMARYTTRIHQLEQELKQLDVLESLARNSGHSMKDGLAFGTEAK